ncbi:hypothetical protein BDV93DRAFT_562584 [Ceratobasidium sp. AG-I]|nr:hypothetical protein BDV93DRAFT_562584 [Ceratobasidium sp. AG-I]
MSLLELFPQFSLPVGLEHLLSPVIAEHVVPVLSLIFALIAIYLSTAAAIYTFLWPSVMFFHPKYLPRSRLRSSPQLHAELQQSLYSACVLALLTYPILYAQHGRFVPPEQAGRSDVNLKTLAAVWFACDVVGYTVHRFFHLIPALYEVLHSGAHQWIAPTPFAIFSSSPLDIFLRIALPPLLVPFFLQVPRNVYAGALFAAYFLGVVTPELSASSIPLRSVFHLRPARFFHALSPPPSLKRNSTRPEINPYTLATSGLAPPPPIESPPKPVNFGLLTTIPDHVFGSFMFTLQDPVEQAEFSAKAWRSSKEALGTKARKTQRSGWSKADKWAGDGVGKLRTIGSAAAVNANGEDHEDGEVDGLLG